MASWVVFDLDETLLRNTSLGMPNGLLGEAERVLRFLADRNIPIALASFRLDAPAVLAQYGLLHYFAAIRHTLNRLTDHRSKSDMIYELAEELNLPVSGAVLFDDLPQNVRECEERGIRAVLVDSQRGVSLEEVVDALMPPRPLSPVARPISPSRRPALRFEPQPPRQAQRVVQRVVQRVAPLPPQRLAANTAPRRITTNIPVTNYQWSRPTFARRAVF